MLTNTDVVSHLKRLKASLSCGDTQGLETQNRNFKYRDTLIVPFTMLVGKNKFL